MATTVLDALENARGSIEVLALTKGAMKSPFYLEAVALLSGAITALENGMGAEDEIPERMLVPSSQPSPDYRT